MKKTVEGICKLCGQKKKLTYEHVPPESAFNSVSVKEFPPEATVDMMTGAGGRKPWDFSGLKGKVNQRGGGGYYLCSDCNNNTGSWYISEYVKLANTFHYIITTNEMELGNTCSFHLKDVFPLRILKAIMTMYCDINNGCMGDDQLREFLLDKESRNFDSEKYKLYIYMASQGMRRISGISAMFIEGIGIVMTSEIGSYPVGTILCIDKPEAYTPPGLLLNSFAEYGYDDKCNVDICGIPYLEINTLFPVDFRSKDAFISVPADTE